MSDDKKQEGSTLGTGIAWAGFWIAAAIAYSSEVISRAFG